MFILLFYPLCDKTFAVHLIVPYFIVKNPKCQAAEELQVNLRQTHRGVACSRHKNTFGRGKKPAYLSTNFQSPWSYPSPKCICPHSTSPFFSWWLNAIYMRTTATKALLPQIAYGDRHMFLIRPWEDNHCFSLILWKQRKMCKGSLTLHQSALPQDMKILQFLL